jgi:acyl-CoA reductase-like NAD-dependent aldehyde dehydrogenase
LYRSNLAIRNEFIYCEKKFNNFVEVTKMTQLARPYVDGSWLTEEGRKKMDIINPYNNEVIGYQIEVTSEDTERALQSAFNARKQLAEIPVYERVKVLECAATLMTERKEYFAKLISLEVGKPLKNTLDEVARSIETLKLSAEAAKYVIGETITGEASERGTNSHALTFRVAVGVVAAITPFNAPLNLICHKIGPSFAAGNATILKPAPQAALIASQFIALLLEAGLPENAVQLILGGVEPGQQIVQDHRVHVVSFTGGLIAANYIAKEAGLKRQLFELGGNAATIVDEDADIDRAVTMCAQTGFSNSGQSCISVQRIYVHERCLTQFTEKLVEKVEQLKCGDPLDPTSDVGTVVNEATAHRIMEWIEEAKNMGASILTGGIQKGAHIQPTVLLNPPKTAKVVCGEVFGPVVSIIPISSFEEGVAEANDSDFGLQVGLFTNNFQHILQASKQLEAGGIVVNGTSNYRLDHWPYGGIKKSGIGREGPRFAIQEMTEMKMIVIRT